MKALILLSGGIDSALALHIFGIEAVCAVGFDYGQPHVIELDYAQALADVSGVPFFRVKLPTINKTDDIVFAGRNAILLASGAAIAQNFGCDTVVIGCNADDRERFPDCRPEFIAAMADALGPAYGVTISAPLIEFSKARIIAMAEEYGIGPTWSCYDPQSETPCGVCLACKLRGAAQ